MRSTVEIIPQNIFCGIISTVLRILLTTRDIAKKALPNTFSHLSEPVGHVNDILRSARDVLFTTNPDTWTEHRDRYVKTLDKTFIVSSLTKKAYRAYRSTR